MMNLVYRPNLGGKFRGYGWPTTLELLKPLDTAIAIKRREYRMVLCPSCSSVHELGGSCSISRHRTALPPANSTTASVKQFWDYYKDRNGSMIKDQFNPFVAETVPPLLLEAYAETTDVWGWCVAFPCVTRSYTTVSVHLLDVVPYNVTVLKADFPFAVRTFEGARDMWFTADIDVDFWSDVLLDYTIKAGVIDAAGNRLDPPWERRVDGVFAGVLRFFEWLAGAAIAEAVMKALSFLVDLIVQGMRIVMEPLLNALLDAIRPSGDRLSHILYQATLDLNRTGRLLPALISDFSQALFSDVFFTIAAIGIVLLMILTIFTPFALILGAAILAMVTVLTVALLATANRNDIPVEDPGIQSSCTASISSISNTGSFLDSTSLEIRGTQTLCGYMLAALGSFFGALSLLFGLKSVADSDQTGFFSAEHGWTLSLLGFLYSIMGVLAMELSEVAGVAISLIGLFMSVLGVGIGASTFYKLIKLSPAPDILALSSLIFGTASIVVSLASLGHLC